MRRQYYDVSPSSRLVPIPIIRGFNMPLVIDPKANGHEEGGNHARQVHQGMQRGKDVGHMEFFYYHKNLYNYKFIKKLSLFFIDS